MAKVFCEFCKNKIENYDEYNNVNGYNVCSDCLSENFEICDECNEYEFSDCLNEAYKNEKEVYICDDCLKKYYKFCRECECYVYKDDYNYEKDMCKECLNDIE